MNNEKTRYINFYIRNDKVAPFRLNPFEFLKESITSRVDMLKAAMVPSWYGGSYTPQIIESAMYFVMKTMVGI